MPITLLHACETCYTFATPFPRGGKTKQTKKKRKKTKPKFVLAMSIKKTEKILSFIGPKPVENNNVTAQFVLFVIKHLSL